MRFFDEVNPKSKEVIMVSSFDEGKILLNALDEFCKNNPRKIKAKKLLEEMTKELGIF